MIDRLLAFGRRLQTRLMLARFRTIRQAGRDLHIGAGSRFWAPDGISLGDAVYVGKDVLVECNAEIGDYVLIANRVALVGRHDHDFRSVGIPVRFSPWIGARQPPSPYRGEKVVVESDVWIGFGATVLSGIRLGRGAVIAAGSVVTRDVPPYAIVAGNPARMVGQRFADVDTICRHEALIGGGDFRFSERGYRHWTVSPGMAAEHEA
jgi:acetyltransferase-like isoleucine patch superfamily enzyme